MSHNNKGGEKKRNKENSIPIPFVSIQINPLVDK